MKKILMVLGVIFLVIIILLVLGLFILPKVLDKKVEQSLPQKMSQAYDSGRKFRIEDVGKALQKYYQQNKSAPNSLQELVDLKLIKSIPIDPETKDAMQYKILEGESEICEVFFMLSTGEKARAFCVPQ
jgi:hypothetical protein